MEKSGFFNSSSGDRVYNVTDFAAYFGDLVGNGIFYETSDNLKVVADVGMSILVHPGSGWINGYHYRNTAPLELTLPTANGVYPRIDRVVLRWDNAVRSINLAVKEGISGTEPFPPGLTRDDDVHELGLADVLVGKGAISIQAGSITDTRLVRSLCGIVDWAVRCVPFEIAASVWKPSVKYPGLAFEAVLQVHGLMPTDLIRADFDLPSLTIAETAGVASAGDTATNTAMFYSKFRPEVDLRGMHTIYRTAVV